MSRILSFIIKIALVLGAAEVMVKETYRMANQAQNAFQHDQISYSAFTKTMLEAKPRKPSQP